MLNETDKKLLSFYMAATNKSATAAEVKNALGYPSVGAVNLHVVRIAKKLASTFSYKPKTRGNGQLTWWPCLFYGNESKHGFIWTLRQDIEKWYTKTNSINLFQQKVQLSLQDADARAKRLTSASKIPKKRLIEVLDFERNPDVVAEVLFQAKGQCQNVEAKLHFFASRMALHIWKFIT